MKNTKKKQKQRGVGDAIASDDLVANLLLNLKQQPSSSHDNASTLPPPPTTTTTATLSMLNPAPWGDCRSRSKPSSTTDGYHQSTRPLKIAGSTTNLSRKRKLDELYRSSTPAEVLAHRVMTNEDLSSQISLLLVKLSCLSPELLTGLDHSLKEAQRQSKRVERYKQKLADRDEEIRQLKEEVENLKSIAKKNESATSKVRDTTILNLKMCLQDVKAQLEYKDGLLVEGVSELDSLEESLAAERLSHSSKEQLLVEKRRSVEEMLVAERDRHSAKEQLWVEERRSLEELLVGERDRHSAKEKVLAKEMQALKDSIRHLQSRVEELLVDNRRLEDDRKWLISEGFSHAIKNVHQSDDFWKPYKDFIRHCWCLGLQDGLKVGYQFFTQGVPLEKLDFYRPRLRDKSKVITKWFYDVRFPYVEKLSSMADQPLDVIRGLKPEKKLDSDTGAMKKHTIRNLVNRVDEFLKELDSGHVDSGVLP